MPHVAICIPSYGDWKPNFCMDVIRLISCLPEDRNTSVELFWEASTILLQGRQDLADQAIRCGATHALFLDTDMRFPSDALLRLLARDKPIIGANYTQRRPPHTATASKDNKRVSSRGRSGIAEVDALGFGVCLIDTSVLKSMRKPWFMFGYRASDGDFVGEDVFFFARAKEAGFQAFIDHDLSQDVRHIGEVELDADMSAIG